MDNYSLMNGQMGVAIFFALLSKASENHWYEEFADELLENVCYNLSNQLPIDFAHGLCGIGWGIEFLKYRGFIEDDTDEILSEIDAAVMERDVRRINDASLETGLLGIHAYVTSRVNTTRVDSDFNPFDSRYISELNEAIAKYIAECIESFIAQTYRNLEIIIVDDGSIDNTKAIAERYALNDSRINVVAISHEGVSHARNVCMSYATGDYILFVDSDDWIGDNLCQELIDLATQNYADIVFSVMTVMPEEGNSYLFGDRSGLFKDAEVMNGKDCFIRMVDTGCTYPMVAGNLYRRSIIVSNKLSFHGKYHEDEYFMPIVVNVAKRVCLSQQSEYYYRYRHGSIMHSKTNIRDRSIVLGEIADLIMDNISLSNQTPTYNRALYQHISTLRQRSRRLYDSYLPDSDKPVLIVFLEKGISSQYGIGTYVGFLSDVMSGESWDVILVEINAYDKSMGLCQP